LTVLFLGLKVKEFIGGTSMSQSIRRTTNCHIAVGTPGRLTHMINEYNMNLSKIKVVALDEVRILFFNTFCISFANIQFLFKGGQANGSLILRRHETNIQGAS
jgi:hypothetical protein